MTNTSKIAALALTATVALGAVATPVLANSNTGLSKAFDGAYLLQQLRYDGIDAVAVSDVDGGTFRATVIDNGHTVFEFFNKDTLQQVK
jgi:hypothetical protein